MMTEVESADDGKAVCEEVWFLYSPHQMLLMSVPDSWDTPPTGQRHKFGKHWFGMYLLKEFYLLFAAV